MDFPLLGGEVICGAGNMLSITSQIISTTHVIAHHLFTRDLQVLEGSSKGYITDPDDPSSMTVVS